MKSSYYFMNNKSFSEAIVPLLHGRQLYPAVESWIVPTYKVSAVFACEDDTPISFVPQ